VGKKGTERDMKRGQSHVNHNSSIYLSDQVLQPPTMACPVLLLKPFLTVFLYNPSLFHVCECCKDKVPGTGDTCTRGHGTSNCSRMRFQAP